MKTIILAGGFGSRLSEKTMECPKPMIEIGGRPIVWHIMRCYSNYGYNEFIVSLGYKGQMIKDFFLNFYALNNDLSIDLSTGTTTIHEKESLSWLVHLIETGMHTQTGGRIKRLQKWIGRSPFMMTYGDGVSDVNIDSLVEFHRSHGKLATVLSVRPSARFGLLEFIGDRVTSFAEKPHMNQGWINGGFFVLEPEIFDYIENSDTAIWEKGPLEQLAKDGELMGYQHTGFWQSMDTLRDWKHLEELWNTGNPPWMETAQSKLKHELLAQ